jgi:pyruvate dehydrogenase E2 component (dihydrolipoamide acetyltransferase)
MSSTTASAPASGLQLNLPAWPTIDFAAFGEVETVPLSRIQNLAAGYLARNWVAIPHVTHQDEADITELDALRKQLSQDGGPKLTPLPFLVKAVATMLARMPRFNASLDSSGKNLVLKKYAHVGIAVDTPAGLLVAVLRDCDKKGVTQIAEEAATISARARAKGLPMSDMVGGSMTVSSLGHIGGTAFTPIVNAPEVAILGATKAQWKPQRPVEGGPGVDWRLMLPLSLSYDHRVINGVDAARFAVGLGELLAQPRQLMS